MQQRGIFTRWALATLGAEGMRICLKLSLVLLVFILGDVAEMGVEQREFSDEEMEGLIERYGSAEWMEFH